ncbi:Rop family plasmid primer RNA-binding protein [Salmonella enterica subsp. enterica serovar Indiana]|nr:Rop family plasmid primer RNA-binding protein [Salmonella enterica subsp. enterica serovar Indiana]
MNRQESAVLNIAKFIRAQTLLLLERIDLLDFEGSVWRSEIFVR